MYGLTKLYNNSTYISNIGSSNCTYSTITVNKEYVYNGKVNPVTVVAHELGHGMGLMHTNNVATLMYGKYETMIVDKPQLDDTNGLKALYGSYS